MPESDSEPAGYCLQTENILRSKNAAEMGVRAILDPAVQAVIEAAETAEDADSQSAANFALLATSLFVFHPIKVKTVLELNKGLAELGFNDPGWGDRDWRCLGRKLGVSVALGGRLSLEKKAEILEAAQGHMSLVDAEKRRCNAVAPIPESVLPSVEKGEKEQHTDGADTNSLNWSEFGFNDRHVRVLEAFKNGVKLTYKQFKNMIGECDIDDEAAKKLIQRVNGGLKKLAKELGGLYRIRFEGKRSTLVFTASPTVPQTIPNRP
jgi:hypothetical protein